MKATSLLNILIVHELDKAWTGVKERLEIFLGEAFIDSMIVLTVPSNGELKVDPDLLVETRSETGTLQVLHETLLSYLAGLGNIEGIRLAVVGCAATGQVASRDHFQQIDRALVQISQSLMQFAVNVPTKEIRIAIIAEGERAPGSPFFSPRADANIIVIPRDLSMSKAVARPILRDQSDLFVGHAAMELASILGMWTVMSNAPVDSLVSKPMGVDGYMVTFMKSRVKGLLAPPLPIGDLVNDADVLPVPSGFAPVDNLEVVVERYADGIYPQNLYFEPIATPDSHKYIKFALLFKSYVVEFFNTLKFLPRTIGNGFDNEIKQIGAETLDNLVGGADARIRPIISNDQPDSREGLTAELLEEIIRDIEYRDGRPVVGGISSEEWDDIATRILGIADGNDLADSDREHVMPSNIVVREKKALAPKVATVSELVELVMPPTLKKVSNGNSQLTATQELPDAGEVDELELKVLEEPREVSGEIDLMALRDAVLRSGLSRPEQSNFVDPNSEVDQISALNYVEDRTLIGYVTRKFDREFCKAENSSIESLNELREFPKRFLSNETIKISFSVILAVCISIGLVITSSATHGIFREVFGLEWISARMRDYLWMSVSSILLVIAISILFSTGSRTWQGRTMLLAGICSALLAVEYFSFGWLREKLSGNSISLKIASMSLLLFAGIILLVLNVVVGLLAIYRSARSENKIRQRLGRGLAILIWLYLVVGASSFLAGPVSFVNTWEDSTRHRFLLACQFVGWVCLFVATLVVVSIRVKQQNSFGVLSIRFKWAQENFIHAIDARRHLRAAYTQWLIIAGALSRIIWHPLGRKVSESEPFLGQLAADDTILKFDIARIELSDEGYTNLLAKLTKMFVRRGWLRTQLNYALDEFKSETAFIAGDSSEDHDPFACPAVPPIVDILNNEARGDRFQFAKKLYEGDFDEALLASATDNNLDTVYSNILGNERLHKVTGSQNQFVTADQFLLDILPVEESSIPVKYVSKLMSAGDGLMTPHLWWPKTSILNEPQAGKHQLYESNILSGRDLNDSVMLMAIMVEVSTEWKNSDVSVIEIHHEDLREDLNENPW
jgi:hypothetical protein